MHKPETTPASIVKLWNDGNDQDGVRPASVKVKLLADATMIALLGLLYALDVSGQLLFVGPGGAIDALQLFVL